MKNQNIGSMDMQQLAVHITQHLKLNNINVVLVGGLAVAFYTENQYLTKDIDMVDISVGKTAALTDAMQLLGFRKKGRVFQSEQTDILVEFPSAPLAVGDELIHEHDLLQTVHGVIPILKAEDITKDRLAAYFHWEDRQSLVQALCIMLCHTINPKQLQGFCEREKGIQGFRYLENIYQSLESGKIRALEEIEAFLLREYLNPQ